MSEHMFYDEGNFFYFCDATPTVNGRWEASVLFERKSDHTKSRVPGLRHKIPDDFATSKEALNVAYHYGAERAGKDETGLE